MNRLLFAVCLASCLFGLVALSACGGSPGGNVPVDSPLLQFEPPDAEDLVPDGDGEDNDDGDDEDKDGNDGDSGAGASSSTEAGSGAGR
jgi:hypothetical protein